MSIFSKIGQLQVWFAPATDKRYKCPHFLPPPLYEDFFPSIFSLFSSISDDFFTSTSNVFFR